MEQHGGKLLRSLRKKRRETMVNIAADAGVTYKTLQGIETGSTKSPSVETLQSIVEALDAISHVPLGDRQKIFMAYGIGYKLRV